MRADPPPQKPLDERSIQLRRMILNAIDGNHRAHIASAFSMIEMLRAIYDEVADKDHDKVILSKGHGCLALYTILADKGYFPVTTLSTFAESGSILGGHPERHLIPGVEVSTGALGHGLPVTVGMALAAKIRRREGRFFVILGDGECNEGSNWEAAVSAAQHRLSSLTVLVDCNGLQSYGPTAQVANMEPMADKWTAFGFDTTEVDGHDLSGLVAALERPVDGRPRAIMCRTVKGRGVARMEAAADWHYRDDIDATTAAELRAELASTAGSSR